MSSPREQALHFRSGQHELLGVFTAGAQQAETAVLIVVGGPQYRVGSHRQFVLLARWLAMHGYPVLRFDVQGMGDSEGQALGFEHQSNDIAAAVDTLLAAQTCLRRVVLWALCDGASSALLYMDERKDDRVAALALVNPWVRTPAGEARTRVKHYYLRRLGEREFWLKLLRGQVAARAARDLWRNLRLARGAAGNAAPALPMLPYTERMARGWKATSGPKLLLMSDNDYTAREFDEHIAAAAPWREAERRQPAERVDLRAADHTCSTAPAQQQLFDSTLAFLQRHFPLRESGANPPSVQP